MTEYTWPCAVLRPRDVAFNLNERTLGASPSVSGYAQVVGGGPPIWTATFGNIDIRTQQHRLAFKAIAALLRGRMNIIRVPMCRGDQPVPAGFVEATVPHSDETPHDDDTEYYQPVISAEVGVSGLAGGVSVNMDAFAIGDVQAGQHFSIDSRLYRIVGVTNNGGGNYDLSIWPPLRVDITAGDWMEFDDPTCRMRLASDQEMNLDLQ